MRNRSYCFWWEESLNIQTVMQVSPYPRQQRHKWYQSVIGSIKLSFVVSSCVLFKVGFPLLFPLFCCVEIMNFHVVFSLGEKPRGFQPFTCTPRFRYRLVFRPCACTSDVLSCPPIPRTLHRIAYWPWIICPGLPDGLVLFFFGVWFPVKWSFDSLVFDGNFGRRCSWRKNRWFFFPSKLGVRKFIDDGGDVQKIVF